MTSSFTVLDETTATSAPAILYYNNKTSKFYYVSDYLQADTRLLQSLYLGTLRSTRVFEKHLCVVPCPGAALAPVWWAALWFLFCVLTTILTVLHGVSRAMSRRASVPRRALCHAPPRLPPTGESTIRVELEWISDDVLGKGISPPAMPIGLLPLDVENWAAVIANLQASQTQVR